MQVRHVLETCLYVDDLEKAERFYRRVLGLEALTRLEGRHVFFRCGDAMLLLFDPEATVTAPGSTIPSHGAQGQGHVAFAMGEGEVEAWREQLLREAVEIEHEQTWPSGGFSLYFRDPAGNCLELATPKTWNLEA